jgi:hypothetical protein
MSQDPDGSNIRRPWRAGPLRDGNTWLALDDDELLHNIETLPQDHAMDQALLIVIQSDRHFFIRQEAAKKVCNTELLLGSADDRHVGQILARRLSRIEDIEYLKRLVAESHHLDVRKAAQAQLRALDGRTGDAYDEDPAVFVAENPRLTQP